MVLTATLVPLNFLTTPPPLSEENADGARDGHACVYLVVSSVHTVDDFRRELACFVAVGCCPLPNRHLPEMKENNLLEVEIRHRTYCTSFVTLQK